MRFAAWLYELQRRSQGLIEGTEIDKVHILVCVFLCVVLDDKKDGITGVSLAEASLYSGEEVL